jgi:5-methylcytosine-specific restriction protein A
MWTARGDLPPEGPGRHHSSTRGWRRTRALVLTRDGGRCSCGAPALEVDHVVPVAEGGTDEAWNLRAICPPCHKIKTQEEAKRGRRVAADRSRRPVEKHPGIVSVDGEGDVRTMGAARW